VAIRFDLCDVSLQDDFGVSFVGDDGRRRRRATLELAEKEVETELSVIPARGSGGHPSCMCSATLWRAWRVVARRRGRPFAEGLTVPSAAATEAAAEARVARAKAEAVKTNVSHAGYVTGTRVLGHHRGAPTMTYAVELHVTPDIVAHPPGGACDVIVGVCDGDGTRDGDLASVTRWETDDAYAFAVNVPRPKPAASDRERHAGLVAAYTDALDAAWGIGHTHFVEPQPGSVDPINKRIRGRDALKNESLESLYPPRGVVAVPLLLEQRATGDSSERSGASATLTSARAAAEAVSAYVPPPHIAARSRARESRESGEKRFEHSFAVRFAAPSDAVAAAWERELETHLGQHYAPVVRAS
jgi:hypothetical protein